jgi:hypothetical protein
VPIIHRSQSLFDSQCRVTIQLDDILVKSTVDKFCIKDTGYLDLSVHGETSDSYLVSIPGNVTGPTLRQVSKESYSWFYQTSRLNP